jgi:glycosyltransferase involved in cell wall biosynthesis
MHKIKILHIIKTLNLGGAETNLFNLVQVFDPTKVETHVAYSLGGEIEESFKTRNVKLFKFSLKSNKIKSFATIAIIPRLIRCILRNKIDIVHTHTFNAHIWGSIAAKITKKKIIEHVHDFRYLDPDEFKKRRGISNQYKYVKYLRNLSDIVVVLTKQNADFLIENNLYPKSRIREIQNGIPLPKNHYFVQENRNLIKNKLSISVNNLLILTPARIAPEKNIDLIFRIAPKVVNEVPGAIFLIAGNGPLLKEFEYKVKDARLHNSVKMLGFQSEIYELLGISNILLLPSFLELHSISILEAMSRKIPVVVSRDVGCNNEFITDWENGVLLDPFSDEGWAEALIKLLKVPGLRQKIGEKGYETCTSKFNINNVARKIESLYNELSKR